MSLMGSYHADTRITILHASTNMARTLGFLACHLLLSIATAWGDQRDEAIRLLQQARDEAVGISIGDDTAWDRGEVLIDVASKLVAAGQLHEATEVVDLLRGGTMSDELFRLGIEAIAVAKARRGDFDGAFESIARPEAGHAMLARRDIAKLLVRRGKVADAIRTCEQVIKDSPRRASGFLVEVAAIARESGDRNGARAALSRAREILQEHRLEADELAALEDLAVAYAHFGDDDTARSLFAQIKKRAEERHEADDEAEHIAMFLADAGYFDEAFKTAESLDPREIDFITGVPNIEGVYGQIGVDAARRGHPEQALRALDRVGCDAIKARVLAAASEAFWKAGRKRDADQAYNTASELMMASKATASVVEMIAECGALIEANLARNSVTEAIAVTEHMPAIGARDEFLRMIVQRQVDDGDLVGAMQTSRRIPAEGHRFAENHRALAFESIVSAEAKSGASGLFERLADEEENPIVHARLLIGRANGLLSRTARSQR